MSAITGSDPGSASPSPDALPWWDGAGRVHWFSNRQEKDTLDVAVSNVLEAVERVRSWVPSWRRAVAAVLAEANKKSDPAALSRAIASADIARAPLGGWSLHDAYSEFRARDKASEAKGLSARRLVGEQVELLTVDLQEAENFWPSLIARADGTPDYGAVAAAAQRALAALQATLQHALFLTYLADARGQRVGSAISFADYASGWELTAAQVSTTWLWLTHDPRLFAERPLPLVLDPPNQRVYRKATSFSPLWWWTTATPLWGGALAYGAIAGLFALLNQAGLTHWPADWPVKLLILVLFVCIGAIAHMASRALSAINYDDPLQVYVAGQALDWLSLRWLAVLRAFIPVTVVVGTLWGAGSIPTAFNDVATAILSGYSADSLFQAGLSRLQSQATSSTATASSPITAQSTAPTQSPGGGPAAPEPGGASAAST